MKKLSTLYEKQKSLSLKTALAVSGDTAKDKYKP